MSSKVSILNRSRERFAWWLLVPTLLTVLVVAANPLLQTIGYSFTDARLASSHPTHFVGLANYARLLGDRHFVSSLKLTVSFGLITVVLELALGLLIALVVNSKFKGRTLLRTAMLVPWAIPTVISAQMWKWMFNDVYGVINDLLLRLGVIHQSVAWIANPHTILLSIAAIDIWKTTPFMALLLLAGLQVISPELYESARVDGASPLEQFWTITLPLLQPIIGVAVIFRTMDALRVFDVFYALVGNRPSFQTLAVYNQQILVDFSRVGAGSAVSVAIFLILAVFVFLYTRLVKLEAVDD